MLFILFSYNTYCLPYPERQRDWPDDARQPLFLNSMVPNPTEQVRSER
jgi:hypothetical protein